MLAFVINFILIFAESGGQGGGTFEWWFKNVDPYLNYPGFEFWRFLNLGIFIAVMVFLVKKPLTGAFKEKREAIRADLIRAEAEKKAAEEKLAEIDAKLERLDEEKKLVVEGARSEAEAERIRIEAEAENDIKRIREQSATEVERKTAQVNVQLKRFSAEESIRLAEEKIRSSINAAADAELVKSNIEAIGGLK